MDKVKFWDQKILSWEEAKYSAPKIPLVDFNSNLKYRRKIACDFLEKYASGKRVLELGCGSGGFLLDFSSLKLKSYNGIDISEVAIGEAQKKLLNLDCAFPVYFETKSCMDFDASKFDFVFSLGLLDWLEKDECLELFRRTEKANWFHSFSSSDPTLLKYAHKTYVYLLYGKKNRGTYVPKYYSAAELQDFSPTASVFRDKKLGICRFIHNLSRVVDDRS